MRWLRRKWPNNWPKQKNAHTKRSIREILLRSMVLSNVLLILPMLFGGIIYDTQTNKSNIIRLLDSNSNVLKTNLYAPLIFEDKAAAREDLTAAALIPGFQKAIIYDVNGDFFAGQGEFSEDVAEVVPFGYSQKDRELYFHTNIKHEAEIVGRLLISLALPTFWQRLFQYEALIYGIFLSLILLNILIYVLIEKSILGPLISLTQKVTDLKVTEPVEALTKLKMPYEVGMLENAVVDFVHQIQSHSRQLQLTHDQLQRTLYAADVALVEKDNIDHLKEYSHSFWQQLNFTYSEIVENDEQLSSLIHLEDLALFNEFKQSLASNVTNLENEVELRIRHKAGFFKWYLFRYSDIGKSVVTKQSNVIFIIDISEIKNTQLILDREKEFAQLALSSIGDGIFTTNLEGSIKYLNNMALRLIGMDASTLIHQPSQLLFHRGLMAEGGEISPINHVLVNQKKVDFEFKNSEFGFNQNVIAIQGRAAPILNKAGHMIGVIVVVRDISSQMEQLDQLNFQASHDSLTGAMNRGFLKRTVDAQLEHAKKYDQKSAVLFVDLDGFKKVNDTFSHAVGDALLSQIAHSLEMFIQSRGCLARVGGDEFVVHIYQYESVAEIEQIALEVITLCSQSFNIDSIEISISASIGISLYPIDGLDYDTLMKKSDVAMYEAKSNGKNQYFIYSEALHNQLQRREEIESNIKLGLDRGEFHLEYQPQLDLKSRKVRGYEALLRWPKGNDCISIFDLIQYAERSGLIIELGEWVFRQACEQHAQWKKDNLSDPHSIKEYAPLISINVSAEQIQDPDFLQTVDRILVSTDADPRLLEIEITETSFLQESKHSIATLTALRDRGFRIALDDFGTGYSNLSYLKSLPIDVIKIDQNFTKDMVGDHVNSTIIKAIIHLAQDLNLEVITEGVESQQQFDFLVACGCNHIQGYYYSRSLKPRYCRF